MEIFAKDGQLGTWVPSLSGPSPTSLLGPSSRELCVRTLPVIGPHVVLVEIRNDYYSIWVFGLVIDLGLGGNFRAGASEQAHNLWVLTGNFRS